jgi:Tol biopolymer transport system component
MRNLAGRLWLCLALPAAAGFAGERGQAATLAKACVSGLSLCPLTAAASPALRDTTLVVRRLWVGTEPDFWASTPSPDGRYVSEVDWMTGDLAVLDLLTGQLRRVTDKGPWDQVIEWAEMSAFSPNGQQLAYSYWNEDLWGYEIRIIDVDGSNERALLPHRDGLEWISVDDWSRDGHVLATLYWQTEENDPKDFSEIALISAATGDVRVLKTLAWGGTWNASFSPDGRFVAYENRPAGQDDNDIFVLATNGSLDEVLIGGTADDRMMEWTPDGASILFYSDRALTEGIWRLPVLNGAAAGEPELVRADVRRATPIGFAGSSFYYGVDLERPQVYTASIDVEGGRLLTLPAAVADPADDRTNGGEWSPDGRYVAYVRTEHGNRPAGLIIRPIAGGDTRELDLSMRQVRAIWWAPDSRSVLLNGVEEEGPDAGIYRLDLESGELTTFVEPEAVPEDFWQFSVSGDGKTFYFARWEPSSRTSRILAWNLETREETELAMALMTGRPSLSPDGRTLVFSESDPATRRNRLVAVPVTGGALQELEISGGAEQLGMMFCGCEWTPDGRYLLATGWNEEAETMTLWRVPSDGGEPLKLAERPAEQGLHNVRLSPDGKRVAFTSGLGRGEIWVMEDFPGRPAELQARGPSR